MKLRAEPEFCLPPFLQGVGSSRCGRWARGQRKGQRGPEKPPSQQALAAPQVHRETRVEAGGFWRDSNQHSASLHNLCQILQPCREFLNSPWTFGQSQSRAHRADPTLTCSTRGCVLRARQRWQRWPTHSEQGIRGRRRLQTRARPRSARPRSGSG